MTLLEKNYRDAVIVYREASDQWNIVVENSVQLGEHTWNGLLNELENAREKARKTWNEFLNNELIKKDRGI